ncbi:uncharacterized protein LOC118646112 [Monomorium pharaonis]|uniref:uncharacterized protein LOC118646112 n=1 Tax=Monomorium pharaonis TaxID=307658 RepID=UPI0017472BB4|nr:uncharacterized protein LOC118646112 [Monomorium pharaonis]
MNRLYREFFGTRKMKNRTISEAAVMKNEENQFNTNRKSVKKANMEENNQNYIKEIMDKKDSLNYNYVLKNTVCTDTKKIVYNDNINISNLHNVNATVNNFAANSNNKENILDSNEIKHNNKTNTSSSDISNIIDSSLISLRKSETEIYEFLSTNQSTNCNINNKSSDMNLNEDYIHNNITDIENEILPIQNTNKKKSLLRKTTLEKKDACENIIIDSSSGLNVQIKNQIENNSKNNEVRNYLNPNGYYMSSDCEDNIINDVFLNETSKLNKQLKQTSETEIAYCDIQKGDTTVKESKKQLCSSQQLDKDFTQFTITEQEESLMTKNNGMQIKNILPSVSKNMHDKEITTYLNNDCNNNSKRKCIITEHVRYSKPKYIILKANSKEINERENKQEILTCPERKKHKQSNDLKNNVSYSNFSSYNDSNGDNSWTNVTQDTTSEYIPNETESLEINKTGVTTNSENSINEVSNVPEKKKYNEFKFNIPGNSACDESELITELSRGPQGNNKKNFCLFCHTLQSKIVRHLESKHCDEDLVKDFMHLPKGCAERLRKIGNVRKEGNFIFNVTKEYNHGRMITVRRPRQKEKRYGINFVNCPYCNGFYARNNLRHHVQQCNEIEGSLSSRTLLQNARRTIGRYHPEASRRMRIEILPILQEDEVTKTIRYDRAIILYGNSMCKTQIHQHQNTYIRGHLRLLGRLVLALRNRNSAINTLADAYAPQFYRTVIEAINNVAELDYKTNMYKHPTNASTLGTCLKKIGKILDVTYMIDKDLMKRKDVDDFMKIYDVDFSGTINKIVTETCTKVKRQKKTILPRTCDIKTLTAYLKRKMEEYTKTLTQEFSYAIWKSLAEVTLIAIQVFNRRRAGETERILIEDFKNYECACGTGSTCKISTQNSDRTHNYVRFTIRGKLRRTVPVLLDAHMLKSTQLLLQFREDANVSSDNPFLFGLPSNENENKHLDACKLMRSFASLCGAKNSFALRGTTLRKHVATKCVDLNLSDNQITRVANFMGHHEHIHKEIYRQPVAKVDILEMSKILEKAQGMDSTVSNYGTDITINSEDNTFFFNQDVSQTFNDISETSTNTSIEKKKNKIEKEEQKVKQKLIIQNKKRIRKNTIKNIQNVQKLNKSKGKSCLCLSSYWFFLFNIYSKKLCTSVTFT